MLLAKLREGHRKECHQKQIDIKELLKKAKTALTVEQVYSLVEHNDTKKLIWRYKLKTVWEVSAKN